MANLDAFPALGTAAKTKPAVPAPKPQLVYDIQSGKKEKRRRDGKRRDHHRLEGQIRGFLGAEYECPLGHRFMSCGNGKICKLGHKDHPKVRCFSIVREENKGCQCVCLRVGACSLLCSPRSSAVPYMPLQL